MKNLDPNKILYLSTHNPFTDIGVENKISGLCNAAEKKGFTIERISEYCRTIGKRRDLLKQALDTDAGVIIIRSFGLLTFALVDLLRKAKKEGRILICDQPTPLSATVREVWHSNADILHKIYNTLWGFASGPWSFHYYNRIIEYSEEGFYYRFGNNNRILLLGNGIDLDRMEIRHHNKKENQSVRIVGVANVSISHGYDRIIRAIAESNGNGTKAYFQIIGGLDSSKIINELKDLVLYLNLQDYVTFNGFQNQEYIRDAFNNSDIAVGALGLHRVGMKLSSILKAREYCLAGIPFITAGTDPDFPVEVPFRFEVPNDESIEPIVEVLRHFKENRKSFTDKEIREYAIQNLGFDKKFDQMMEGLL